MIVPNYIPDALQVTQNVTLEPYQRRVQFLRRVFRRFGVTVVLLVAGSWLPLPVSNLVHSAWLCLITIGMLSIERTLNKGRRQDVWYSLLLLPGVWFALCNLIQQLQHQMHIPVWGAAVGTGFLVVYSEFCGRDFSFVGQYVLSLIGSSAVLSGLALVLDLTSLEVRWLLGINLVVSGYLVYDAASLLSRRRVGEEWGAVADLYRDFLNIVTYIPRVIAHWRKHRIFGMPVRYSRH